LNKEGSEPLITRHLLLELSVIAHLKLTKASAFIDLLPTASFLPIIHTKMFGRSRKQQQAAVEHTQNLALLRQQRDELAVAASAVVSPGSTGTRRRTPTTASGGTNSLAVALASNIVSRHPPQSDRHEEMRDAMACLRDYFSSAQLVIVKQQAQAIYQGPAKRRKPDHAFAADFGLSASNPGQGHFKVIDLAGGQQCLFSAGFVFRGGAAPSYELPNPMSLDEHAAAIKRLVEIRDLIDMVLSELPGTGPGSGGAVARRATRSKSPASPTKASQ
jgi:hypothetical protein